MSVLQKLSSSIYFLNVRWQLLGSMLELNGQDGGQGFRFEFLTEKDAEWDASPWDGCAYNNSSFEILAALM